jgi:enoyl-[acyl-carrier protein] reductase II
VKSLHDLGIDAPIIQAPMTYIAGAQLAAAVSNAGGLGMIETASAEGRRDLARVRDLTDRPVGANINLKAMRDPSIVDTLVAHGIQFVTTSAGDPTIFGRLLREAGITCFHVVGSLSAAHKAVAAGVDGLVVEGVEGGGYKNPLGASTMVLLPLVATTVTLPVIAAGGICDGRSMAAALVMGASGVQMGTRFVASVESPVHDNFKRAIVEGNDTGTRLVSVEGLPTMRVIRTNLAEEAAVTGTAGPVMARMRDLYFEGDMEASLANTGQVSSRIDSIETVSEIVRETWLSCLQTLADAHRAWSGELDAEHAVT